MPAYTVWRKNQVIRITRSLKMPWQAVSLKRMQRNIAKLYNKGFVSSESYYEAKEGSFSDPAQYEEARKIGIVSNTEFERFNELNAVKDQYGFQTMQHAEVYQILNEHPEGKKLAVARIWDMLQESQNSPEICSGK